MNSNERLTDRLNQVMSRAEQELRDKGASQAIRDDMAQLKDDVKAALSNDKPNDAA